MLVPQLDKTYFSLGFSKTPQRYSTHLAQIVNYPIDYIRLYK